MWRLERANDDYLILTEGESDTHALWSNEINALGFAEAPNLKEELAPIFKRFKKIYVHDKGAKLLLERACKVIPYEKLFVISARAVDKECRDPSDLHIRNLLNFDDLIATAHPVDKEFYDEKNKEAVKEVVEEEIEKAEHVVIAEEVMKRFHIRFWNEDFYVYENGVYHPNLHILESTILEINENASKHLQNEVLNFIRIRNFVKDIQINEQYINFKNRII